MSEDNNTESSAVAAGPSNDEVEHVMSDTSALSPPHEKNRQHRDQLVDVMHTNHVACEALRSIDEKVCGKDRKAGGVYSKDIHRMLESCLEQERHLFTAIPKKFAPKKSEPHSASLAVTAERSRKKAEAEERALALITSPDGAEFDEPRDRSPEVTEALRRPKEPPLPCRNFVPKSHQKTLTSPSRYENIPSPAENKRELVDEKRRKAVEKMLVPPGAKHPPPSADAQFEFKPPKEPVKKPADWVPECSSKIPAHWPEPEKAAKPTSTGFMRFRTNGNGNLSPSRSVSTSVAPAAAEEEGKAEPAEE